MIWPGRVAVRSCLAAIRRTGSRPLRQWAMRRSKARATSTAGSIFLRRKYQSPFWIACQRARSERTLLLLLPEWLNLLEDWHGRNGANDNIVVSVKQDGRGEAKCNVRDFAVLLDVLPERALLVAIFAYRRAIDLGDLFSRIAVLLVRTHAVVVHVRHGAAGKRPNPRYGESRRKENKEPGTRSVPAWRRGQYESREAKTPTDQQQGICPGRGVERGAIKGANGGSRSDPATSLFGLARPRRSSFQPWISLSRGPSLPIAPSPQFADRACVRSDSGFYLLHLPA